MTKTKKPWAGRFTKATAKSVEAFTCSLSYDSRLYRYDIKGSMAHAAMLAEQGIISRRDERAILGGLKSILADMDKGKVFFDSSDEDIHMAIEKELIRRVGEAGGKLHTARSRNDQIALDVRLYLLDEIDKIAAEIRALIRQLVRTAKEELATIMPGYTHLQKAQPVLLSHYLLAFVEMFLRDAERFADCRKRTAVMPLGAAALAGTGLPIDREKTAGLLGFSSVTQNSMDTVADRDYIAEFIFDAALCAAHLSRFCEDLVLWSSDEFGYAVISDAYTTGSSIMPQKKNPDIAELIRGKTGRIYGDLVAVLTLLKGLPMTYNRDLQEDKEPLFDAADTLRTSLAVFTEMLANTSFNAERMRAAARGGFSTATDLAEYLVEKGVPFRRAHEVVGRIVAYCIGKNKTLEELTPREFKTFAGQFDPDVVMRIRLEQCVDARKATGGTATKTVRERIRKIEKTLDRF